MKIRVMFTYTQDLIQEPIIYTLGQMFNLTTNIHSANIAEDSGWALVDIEGNEANIRQGLDWVMSRGLRFEEIPGEDTSEND
ncbi:NIL domain-containing protein [Chloroflexota bacterium]